MDAVAQHEGVVLRGEQRVERHGDGAHLDGAEEDGGEVDAVEQAERHALLDRAAQGGEGVAGARHALAELGVGERPAIVDERDLAAASLGHVPIDEIDRGVVVARDGDAGRGVRGVDRGVHRVNVPRLSRARERARGSRQVAHADVARGRDSPAGATLRCAPGGLGVPSPLQDCVVP
jgi:hypothetical protein